MYIIVRRLSVRLINADGNPSHEGRVEVYFNYTWGTVCSNGWDIREANIVCRMLKYPFALGYKTSTHDHYGEGSGPVWMSGLDCTGIENSLSDCPHTGFTTSSHCDHNMDVGVACASNYIRSCMYLYM